MAVKLEGTIKRWIGLSTDIKPKVGLTVEGLTITANDLPVGSSFLEEDTGRIWRYNSVEWVVPVPSNEQAEYLQAILFELANIKETIVESFA